jgi:2-hydroxychromene-2-carboxylate isomerase
MSCLDDAKLLVALDLRDPFSYLALGPTIALAAETGVSVDWLPIHGHTLVAPSSPAADDDRGVRHRRARAEMIAREIVVYSEAQGLDIQSPYRDGSSDAVDAAWLWIRLTNESGLIGFLDAVFRKYWTNDLDPESNDDVSNLVESLELDSVAFQRWALSEGVDAVRSVATDLAELGMHQAPAYRIDGEIYYGRQHLPMIRWVLGGRSGEGPI